MTTKDSNTHNPTPADQPLALRLSEGLGPNARKLASQLQNAAYNCGYEDADPANATTRQAKADERCRKVLAALYEEIERLQAAESVAMVRALKLEAARRELAKVNNEFGSETADWPDAWRRVAEVKERAGRLWRDNEMLRAALTVVVRDWTEQFERNGHLAPAWVRQAREALGPNV